MPALRQHRVTALPGTLEANSAYFVAPAATPDFLEVYLVGNTAGAVRRVLTQADVQDLIDAAAAASGHVEIVADIAARDALAGPVNGLEVAVLDATGDATVASGGATYLYRAATTSWVKQSEWASQDLALTWAALQGKPTSSVAAIDAAVGASHTHANASELAKVGQDAGGDFTYSGQHPRARLDTTAW